MTDKLLEVEGLTIGFKNAQGVAQVVSDLNLEVKRGQIHGLVGESGSGKSVTARSILGLNPKASIAHQSGDIRHRNRSLLTMSESQLRRDIRGREISMIFQDPMTALNPVLRIGTQLTIPLRQRRGLSRIAARSRAVQLLEQVGLPNSQDRFRSYPHQLSGGQRQRVMIAIALACEPSLLIADEPTTALDVTVQAQIMDLLVTLRDDLGLAILLISHDLTLIAERCDDVSVMYAGRIVEDGDAREIFVSPRHPYTALLERARPRLENGPHQFLQTIKGMPPNLVDLPAGCAFAPRCPRRSEGCDTDLPALADVVSRSAVACWHPLDDGKVLDAAPVLDQVST